MKGREQFEKEIVALVKIPNMSQTVSDVCLTVAALYAETLCTDEVFSLCLDLQRSGRISFLMAANGAITVY
jgi:hypothetical protein